LASQLLPVDIGGCGHLFDKIIPSNFLAQNCVFADLATCLGLFGGKIKLNNLTTLGIVLDLLFPLKCSRIQLSLVVNNTEH